MWKRILIWRGSLFSCCGTHPQPGLRKQDRGNDCTSERGGHIGCQPNRSSGTRGLHRTATTTRTTTANQSLAGGGSLGTGAYADHTHSHLRHAILQEQSIPGIQNDDASFTLRSPCQIVLDLEVVQDFVTLLVSCSIPLRW